MTGPRISEVRFTSAHADDADRGLVGFITCLIDDSIRLDGIMLRRTRAGDLALSFPARRDAAGRHHPYVRPISDSARRDVERQVFAALAAATSPQAPQAESMP